MNPLMQSFKDMGPGKLAALAGTAVLLLGFFAFLATRSSGPTMAPLYSGLSMQDGAQIVKELDSVNVPYQITAGGSQIMVPADQVLKLRMDMAQEGLPSSGNIVGYEIFDRSDKLGTSSFVHNVNMLRALEGELARTIGGFNKIENARVHLVLPKRELFTRERQKPSASVTIKMRGVNELTKGEIEAVRNLVASSVPELKPSGVTVVDSKGAMLARGGDEEETGATANMAAEFRANYERNARDIIEKLLANIVGNGRARAEVTADIDFDRIVTNKEIFDPEGQVARSVKTSEENENSRERDMADNVSVANQLPDAQADNATTGTESNRAATDELVNYEISKEVTNHIKESGSVKRLSVAVLVDGVYSTDAEGVQTYAPRSQEELDKLTALVRSAVGYDESRGDIVQLVNMQFSERPDAAGAEGPFEWLKQDLQGIIQTLVIGIVAILAILLIVRPIVNRVIEATGEAKEDEEDAALAEHLALLGPDLAALTDQRGYAAGGMGGIGDDDEMVDIDRIQGKVRSSAVKKVQDILTNNPEQALVTLRGWINERNAA
ncbi:MAG: flagellar M-ring protein FliF [Alphaproteobacteria bacterium]|nr:flagellar M-ring protein FliF [Alphaproteobacteria bacterium]